MVSVWASYNSELLGVRSGCLAGAQGEPPRSLALCWLWKIFYKTSRKDLLSTHHLGMDPPQNLCPQWLQWLGHLPHGPLGLFSNFTLRWDVDMLPYTYVTLSITLALWPSRISGYRTSLFYEDVTRSHLHSPAYWSRQALACNCKRTRSPHIPAVSSSSLSMCMGFFLFKKVSSLNMLVTSLQGQTLSFRLETHLLCQESTVFC